MRKLGFPGIVIAASVWLLPVAGHAIDAPPLDDSPFFGWLAVPVAGIVGHRLLKHRKGSGGDKDA